jgi:hypothetical protein
MTTPTSPAPSSRYAPSYRQARELLGEARDIRRQCGSGAFYEGQAAGLLEAVDSIRGEIRRARKAVA